MTLVQIRSGYEQIRRLSREGTWVVAGQLATVLGALVSVRVLTEYLNPMQYGHLTLGLTAAGLVNKVIMGGVSAGISRYYSVAAEEGDFGGYIRGSGRLLAYAAAVVAVIALLLLLSISLSGQGGWTVLVAALLVFSLVTGFNFTLSGIQNAARQRPIVALHGGADAWLRIILAVGAIAWLGTSSTAVVVGYSMSATVIIVSQGIFLHKLMKDQLKTEPLTEPDQWQRRIWSYSWPFSAWGLFTWAQQVSDRWSLELFATTTDVGHYAVIYQLGFVPIGLATTLAVSFFGPILYQRSGPATDEARNAVVHQLAWSVTGLALAATAFAFIVTLMAHDSLFDVLVSSSFRSSSRYLPWLVLAGGIFAASQLLALKLMSEMKPRSMIEAKVVTAVVGVLLNLYGAWKFGVPGVVASMVVFSVAHFLWIAVIARKNTGVA